MRSRLYCFLCAMLMFILSACNVNNRAASNVNAEPDYWPTEGWKTASPESQGMDSQFLADAIDFIVAEEMDIHSLLIIRNGYIVEEAYFAPYQNGSLHDVASVTKSITSTLMGIAIDQGFIESANSTVGDYIPEASEDITDLMIENLLTMSTGFNLYHEGMQLYEMLSSPDWLGYINNLDVNPSSTGNEFKYNSFGPYLCSTMINNTVQTDSLEFADSYLFSPLGIDDYQFSLDPRSGAILGYGDLWISPRDLAKIGYLYLNGGQWDGEQILSNQWVEEATSQKIEDSEEKRPGVTGYGYFWWIDELGSYSARGRDNQRLEVFPEENLIVVINSGCGKGLTNIYNFMNELYTDYILKSLISDTPIDENEQGYSVLQEKCAQVEVVEPDILIGSFSGELDEKYINKVYTVEPNMLGVEKIELVEEDEGTLTLDVSLATFGVPDSMEVKIGPHPQWQYSNGRHGLPLVARLLEMDSNELRLSVNEIGNIDVWEMTIKFTDSGVSMAFVDKLGEGKDMVLTGTLAE